MNSYSLVTRKVRLLGDRSPERNMRSKIWKAAIKWYTFRCWDSNASISKLACCLIPGMVRFFHLNSSQSVLAIAVWCNHQRKYFTLSVKWKICSETSLDIFYHKCVSLKSFRCISTFTTPWIFFITWYWVRSKILERIFILKQFKEDTAGTPWITWNLELKACW